MAVDPWKIWTGNPPQPCIHSAMTGANSGITTSDSGSSHKPVEASPESGANTQPTPTQDPEKLDHVPSALANFRHNHDFGVIPIPKRLRYGPAKPFPFRLPLMIAFALFSTFTVSNLYYCQPLLIQLSNDFRVTYSEISRVPTLVQAGYATGLLLISPLGDLVRRRQLILATVITSTGLTIGLATTNSLVVFEVLSYLVGAASVTPQILIPLAADLAPDHRRASSISIVLSGLLFGILVARVLAGAIAEFASWRVVYYFAIGVQAVVLLGNYLLLPDYPSKNKHLTYFHILWTMAKFSVTEPILIQACLINLSSSACFSNFWVTLTFLLGGPPYHYSTLLIGLFGLIGMAGVAMSPVSGIVIDKLYPWHASFFAIIMLLIFQAIQTAAGGIHVAAVIIAAFGLDVFRQNLQVSLSTAVFSIEPAARARMNAVSILSIFIGQVLGTSVGTLVFVKYGWQAGAALSLGWTGWQILILLLRGPHCRRYTWFGYEGGLRARRAKPTQAQPEPAPHPSSTASQDEKASEHKTDEEGARPSEQGHHTEKSQ